MDCEHDKLIAKIQFFYDILSLKHDLVLNEIFEKRDEESLKISNTVLSVLADEYRKLFENILYME